MEPFGDGDSPRVLLLEDDLAFRELLVNVLEDAGYEVVCTASTAALVDRVVRGEPGEHDPPFDVIVSDIRMPHRTGLEVLEELRHYDFLQPVVLITGFGSRETHEEALRLGAVLLDKPFEMDELLQVLDELCPPPPAASNAVAVAA